MTDAARQRLKIVVGLVLGVAIGAACRVFGIPSPAPGALQGAVLVVAMTLGYAGTDRLMRRSAPRQRSNCGGPDGSVRKQA